MLSLLITFAFSTLVLVSLMPITFLTFNIFPWFLHGCRFIGHDFGSLPAWLSGSSCVPSRLLFHGFINLMKFLSYSTVLTACPDFALLYPALRYLFEPGWSFCQTHLLPSSSILAPLLPLPYYKLTPRAPPLRRCRYHRHCANANKT